MSENFAQDVPDLALGSYGLRGDLVEVAKAAIGEGVRVLDSAPNYRKGLALQEIGQALRNSRDFDLRLMTKVGYFVDPSDAVRRGLATDGDIVGTHALTPASIRFQLAYASEMLGRQPSLAFVHNPERQLANRSEREFHRLMSEVFASLEDAVEEGLIRSYGVATWARLTAPPTPSLSVPGLLRLATQAAGPAHRLSAIQLPVSLVRVEAAQQVEDSGSPIGNARAAGLEVVASSPLHGGALPKMLSPDFVRLFGSGLSPEQACLSFVRSVPGISTVVFGASSADQAAANIEFWRASGPLSAKSMRQILDLVA